MATHAQQKTNQVLEKLKKYKKDPLDYLLDVTNGLLMDDYDIKTKEQFKRFPTAKESQYAATVLLPVFYPKLTATTVENTSTIEQETTEELTKRLESVLAAGKKKKVKPVEPSTVEEPPQE